MSDTVVGQASQYLRLMSQLTPPDAFYFRSYAADGVRGLAELCGSAATLATASEAGALASLVVAPGEIDAFTIDGTHARATLSLCPTPHTRLYVIVGMLIAVLLLILWLRRR